MKSVEVIQKVQILPRATASHQPGSETRWREADKRQKPGRASQQGLYRASKVV